MKDIGFIGLGTMGKPMGRNLMKAGYNVIVHSRSRGPVDEMSAEGAKPASSPAEVAQLSDLVIMMVPDSPDVEKVMLGPEGVLFAAKNGQVAIDMSTISPAVARKVYKVAKGKGVRFLDAPVSGGESGAVAGTLSIMVGGDKDTFDAALPVFEVLGKNIIYMGESGSGQTTKLCNQVLCGLNILAVAEGLMLGRKAGIDPEKLLSAVSDGAASSWMLTNLGPKIIERDWRPGFKVALQQKDLRLALDAAAENNVPLPGTALASELFRSVQAHGRGDQGTQAMITAFETLAGISED